MTTQHLKWIAGAIVALLVIWGGARLLRSGSDDAGAGGFRMARVAADSADTILVAAPAETIVVARAPSGLWTVNGYPGSAQAVAEFQAALRDSSPAELVAQSAASFARLGVDSVLARRVRVAQGNLVLLDILVSERGPDMNSAYVRLPDDSAVYAQQGQLAAVARRRLDDWRDKTIAVINPDSVGEVELARGARRVVLRKRDGTWRLATGAVADTAAVRRLLEKYRVVTAAGFPTTAQLDSVFRRGADRRASVRGFSGAVLVTLEFDSIPGGYWARKPGAGRDAVFRMNTWDVDELVPAEATLRAK
jgi:hypothetical protein